MNKETQSIGEKIGREIGGGIGKGIEQEIRKAAQSDREHVKEEAKKAGWWNWIKRADKKRKKGFKYPDAIFGVLFTGLFLWIAYSLETWGLNILTPDWPELLDVIRITSWITIVTWLVLLVVHPKPIFFLGKTLIDAMGVWGAWATIAIFPFDFSVWGAWSWVGVVFLILAWCGLIFTPIMILVRGWRFVLGKDFD